MKPGRGEERCARHEIYGRGRSERVLYICPTRSPYLSCRCLSRSTCLSCRSVLLALHTCSVAVPQSPSNLKNNLLFLFSEKNAGYFETFYKMARKPRLEMTFNQIPTLSSFLVFGLGRPRFWVLVATFECGSLATPKVTVRGVAWRGVAWSGDLTN